MNDNKEKVTEEEKLQPVYHDIEMDGRLYYGADGFALIHSVIHTSVKVKESVFQHTPVVEYAKKCRPAQDYRDFIAEIVPELGTV